MRMSMPGAERAPWARFLVALEEVGGRGNKEKV